MLEKLPNHLITEDNLMDKAEERLQNNISPVKNIIENLCKEARLALKNTEI